MAKSTRAASRREVVETELRRVRAWLDALEIAPIKTRKRVFAKLASALDATCVVLRTYDADLAMKHVDGRNGLATLTAQLTANLRLYRGGVKRARV